MQPAVLATGTLQVARELVALHGAGHVCESVNPPREVTS